MTRLTQEELDGLIAQIIDPVATYHGLMQFGEACAEMGVSKLQAQAAEAYNETPLIELWNGERKVTVYPNTVLRSWGANTDTEMSDEPHSLKAVQSAADWLYEPPVQAVAVEPARPDILERLTYHKHERDDLTLDQCLDFLANGWKTVRGRTERQMVLQILAGLAGAPPQDSERLREARDAQRYRWLRDPARIPNGEGDGHLIVGDGGGEDILWSGQLDRRIDEALAANTSTAPKSPELAGKPPELGDEITGAKSQALVDEAMRLCESWARHFFRPFQFEQTRDAEERLRDFLTTHLRETRE